MKKFSEMTEEEKWDSVKHRFGLDDEEIRMAKKLHFEPKGILNMAPSKAEPWKVHPALYIRRCFDKKFGCRTLVKRPEDSVKTTE